ncbi:MAG: hypothetical protein U5L96_07250 [Owenweeksia sp.]|nr:hypothetical protein [Owenweeksia sp.]
MVIAESSKAYLNKEVDRVNQHGAFTAYKDLVQRVCDVVLELNPHYRYPHMLISTVVEGAHLQRFFAEHLPRLTDTDQKEDLTCTFYHELVFKALEK